MRDLNSTKVPINPKRHYAKESSISQFCMDIESCFTGGYDMFDFILAFISAVILVINWVLFLIGKFVLRLNLNKPKVKKKHHLKRNN